MIGNILTFSSLEIALIGILCGLFLIQLFYYLVIYGRPLRASQKEAGGKEYPLEPVSVIVYTLGDSEYLRQNLPVLLQQDYPEYEVIVVNDGSDAESEDVLKLLSQEYKHLYYTYVPINTQYLSHKKLALTMGIKAAKHELLLFTEAECKPTNRQWIRSMVANYTPATEIVLGFCSYPYHSSMNDRLIGYKNLLRGLQILSQGLQQKRYIGDGRNLSYRKAIFYAHKGYAQSLNLHEGADDLFINQVETPTNVRVQYTPDSILTMNRFEEFNRWQEMEIARATTQQFLKGGASSLFQLGHICSFCFVALSLSLIVMGIMGHWLLSIFSGLLLIARYATKMVIFQRSALLLQQKPLTVWIPFLEIQASIHSLCIRFYRLFRRKKDFTTKL